MAVSPYLGHVYDDGELGEEAVSPYLGHVYDDGELGEEAVDLGVKHGNLAEGEGEASVGIWGVDETTLAHAKHPICCHLDVENKPAGE